MSNRISNQMASRLANVSQQTGRAFTRPTRIFFYSRRHQSTTPQPAEPAQSLQSQQPSPSQVARHPSAVSHPELRSPSPERRGNDNTIVLVFGGLLIACVPLSYWYWGYRERAMKAKKEEMLRGIQERYAARHGTG